MNLITHATEHAAGFHSSSERRAISQERELFMDACARLWTSVCCQVVLLPRGEYYAPENPRHAAHPPHDAGVEPETFCECMGLIKV